MCFTVSSTETYYEQWRHQRKLALKGYKGQELTGYGETDTGYVSQKLMGYGILKELSLLSLFITLGNYWHPTKAVNLSKML